MATVQVAPRLSFGPPGTVSCSLDSAEHPARRQLEPAARQWPQCRPAPAADHELRARQLESDGFWATHDGSTQPEAQIELFPL
jgi:hypothetical protein